MQKRAVGLALVLISLFVLSSVIVSAFSFSDLWNDFLGKKTVTGNVVSSSDKTDDLNPTNKPFTISAWINTEDDSFMQSIYSKWYYAGAGTNNPKGFEFALNYPNAGTFTFWDGVNFWQEIPSGIEDGGDYHIAAVRDGTTITFYTNGEKKGSITVTSNIPDVSSVTSRIGRSHYDLSSDPILTRPFKGTIKNSAGEIGKVDLYSRALTSEEIKQVYSPSQSNSSSGGGGGGGSGGGVIVICSDSDGGKDYYVKGAVNVGTDVNYTDTCISDSQPSISGQELAEYSCVNNIRAQHSFLCPNGCSNGACIQSTTTNINRCSELSSAAKAKIEQGRNLSKYYGTQFITSERDKAKKNDYVVMYSNQIRVLRVASIPSNSSVNNKVMLTDALSGETYDFTTGTGQRADNNIDGQHFNLYAYNSESVSDLNRYVTLTWGTGSSYGNPGSEKDSLNCFADTVSSKCVATAKKDYGLPSAVIVTNATASSTMGGYCDGNYYNQVYCVDAQGSQTLSGVKAAWEKYLCPEKCVSNSEGKEGACYSSGTNYNTCTDSDYGDSTFTKGKITGVEYIDGVAVPFEKEDSCNSDGKHLIEYVCNDFGSSSTGTTATQECENGCKDGKCVEKTTVVAKQCTPKIECTTTPAVCPESGKQIKECVDLNNCADSDESRDEISCTPGDCSGCFLNKKCMPYGFRTVSEGVPSYCDATGEFSAQMTKDADGNWAKCQNNYECSSNVCSDGECIEVGAIANQANGLRAFLVNFVCKISNMGDPIGYETCMKELGIAQ